MKMLSSSTRGLSLVHSICYIELIYFPLHYMDSNSGTSKEPYYIIPQGIEENAKTSSVDHGESKLLLALFLSISILINS